MPTLRSRAALSDAPYLVAALESGDFSPRDDADPLDLIMFCGDDERQRAVWARVGAVVLARWQHDLPGTRPWAWWEFDAPRWALEAMPARIAIGGAYWVGRLPEPRRRLGGIGTPEFEALNTAPALPFGIPAAWVEPWAVSYYNGRAVDVHGHRIGTEYAEGHFPHPAIDPTDPPRFESQAAYLDRHGLLSAAERKRLSVDAFAPDTIRPLVPQSPRRGAPLPGPGDH